MADLPALLWNTPADAFAEQYRNVTELGSQVMSQSSVAFVGLARNCGPALAGNLERMKQAGEQCGKWQSHIESNDCTDNTLDVLAEFCGTYRQATFHYHDNGRPHCSAEFAGRRTIALAEYRDTCQRWVRACASDCDYVVVIDWDMWAGWEPSSIANAIGWLQGIPQAAGMASVSLYQWAENGRVEWRHYDLWALRGVGQPLTFFDQYQNGYGVWGFWFFPPIGSEPIQVASAFGGMAVYRKAEYLAGTYDGTTDCEHVAFHKSIRNATGKTMFLNPSQRTLMHWLEDDNAGHRIDGVQDVPSNAA